MVAYETWHVVQTHPGKETVACTHLDRQGFRTFLPRLKAGKSPRRRNAQAILRPLFPGYVFAAFDAGKVRWQAIDSTIGVSRLVKFGDRPARMECSLVDRLMELSESGFVSFQEDLQPDDKVRILAGPFDDWIGRVVGLAEGNRALVLLQMATRSVRIEIGREDLVRAA